MLTQPARPDLRIVTVYIRPKMYERFFTLNPVVNGYSLLGIDNRESNLGLPARYNQIITEQLDQNCWLFFVHEDFEIQGGLEGIADLTPDCIYGTFGIKLVNGAPVPYGRHICSNKDGTDPVEVGTVLDRPESVQTIDCQSVLVHSSLLARYPSLRFDEQLSFDLYAEDFAITARERLQIDVRVFPLVFQHYSHGKVTQRYLFGLRYLAEKYPQTAVAGSCSFIGGRAHELERHFTYAIRANQDGRPVGLLDRVRARLGRWRANRSHREKPGPL